MLLFQFLQLDAGDSIPECSATVCNAAGKAMVRAMLGGARASLVVTQSLYFHPVGKAQSEAANTAPAETATTGTKRASKKRARGGAAVASAAETTDPGSCATANSDGAIEPELVLSVRNASPIKDVFQFETLVNGLKQVGRYTLEFAVEQMPDVKVSLADAVAPVARVALICTSGNGPAPNYSSGPRRRCASVGLLLVNRACLGVQKEIGECLPVGGSEGAEVYMTHSVRSAEPTCDRSHVPVKGLGL